MRGFEGVVSIATRKLRYACIQVTHISPLRGFRFRGLAGSSGVPTQ